jgi:hypothetical protein
VVDGVSSADSRVRGRVIHNRLFYPGASLPGSRLIPRIRHRLSYVLDSPLLLYVQERGLYEESVSPRAISDDSETRSTWRQEL